MFSGRMIGGARLSWEVGTISVVELLLVAGYISVTAHFV